MKSPAQTVYENGRLNHYKRFNREWPIARCRCPCHHKECNKDTFGFIHEAHVARRHTREKKKMPLVLGVDALAGTTVKDLVREVASRPTNPTVLYNFAATLERSGKDSLAAVVYMRALDFETEGSEEWAETVAAMCMQPAR